MFGDILSLLFFSDAFEVISPVLLEVTCKVLSVTGLVSTGSLLEKSNFLFFQITFSSFCYAEWSEIDFENCEWRIPASKMKIKRTHIVLLARQVIELLKKMFSSLLLRGETGKAGGGGGYFKNLIILLQIKQIINHFYSGRRGWDCS